MESGTSFCMPMGAMMGLIKLRIMWNVIRPIVVHKKSTVNSEIFARVLFSRNFAYAKFREN